MLTASFALPAPAHRSARGLCAAACVALALAACSPTFDWREAQADAAPVAALFPCKPDRFSRPVTVAGVSTTMRMLSCSAGDATFALSHATMADPARVGPALQALRQAAADNVGAPARVLGPAGVPGMTPQPLAERLQVDGRRPDGSPLRLQALFFTSGAEVYQATVVASTLNAEAVDTFFAGVRLPR